MKIPQRFPVNNIYLTKHEFHVLWSLTVNASIVDVLPLGLRYFAASANHVLHHLTMFA